MFCQTRWRQCYGIYGCQCLITWLLKELALWILRFIGLYSAQIQTKAVKLITKDAAKANKSFWGKKIRYSSTAQSVRGGASENGRLCIKIGVIPVHQSHIEYFILNPLWRCTDEKLKNKHIMYDLQSPCFYQNSESAINCFVSWLPPTSCSNTISCCSLHNISPIMA